MIVFPSVAEALRAGYEIYDRTPDGYVVRTRTESGYALAVVELAEEIPRLRRARHVSEIAG